MSDHLEQARAGGGAVRHPPARHRHVPPGLAGRVRHPGRGDLGLRGARGRRTPGPLAVELDFPYHPHVTIAHHLDDPTLDRAFEELADFECGFAVDAFSLYVHDSRRRLAAHRPLRAWAERGARASRTSSERIADRAGASAVRRPPRAAVEHYGHVNGSALAAAVTYFAFLSFFPILALAFAIFGQVAKVYDNAEDTLVDAANSSCPGSSAGRAG